MQVLTRFSFGMKNVDNFLAKLRRIIVIRKMKRIREYVRVVLVFVFKHIAFWEHLLMFIVYFELFAFTC